MKARDVREIKAELRVVAEHSTALEVLRGRVGTLEQDRDAARERLRDVERELHAVRGPLSARKTHHGTPKPGWPGAEEPRFLHTVSAGP